MPPRAARLWFALLVCVAAVPVLWHARLPLQDLPQHVLIARVLSGYDDPGSDFCQHFVEDFALRPYVGFYGVAWLLSSLLSVDACARLSLLFYLVATPCLVWGYTRALSPGSAPAAFIALAALYNVHYYLGWINFLMALPFVFAGLWAMLAFTRLPSPGAACAFVVAAAGAYLCHVTAFAVLILASLAYGAIAPRRARRLAIGLVLAMGTAAVLLTPGRESVLTLPDVALVGPDRPKVAYPNPRGFQYQHPLVTVMWLPAFVANDATLGDAALWGMPLGALGVAAWRSRRAGAVVRGRPERFVLPLLAVAMLFLVPDATPSLDYVNAKLVAFVFLSLPALVPARWLDRRTCVTLVVFAAASLAYSVTTHARFAREARGFDEVLDHVPPGCSVLPLIFQPRSQATLWTVPYLFYGSLVQAEKGGLGCEIFEGPQMPVRLRPCAATGMIRFIGQPWLIASGLGPFVPQYVLTRGAGGREWLLLSTHEKVAESGSFALYRHTVEASPDPCR